MGEIFSKRDSKENSTDTHGFAKIALPMLESDQTSLAPPLIALRKFKHLDTNFDKSNEILTRVIKSSFDQLYVVKQLKDENDVQREI